ncbi:MAG: hypothetical protein ACRES9_09880 [Gammaproteobacteria bacterium]
MFARFLALHEADANAPLHASFISAWTLAEARVNAPTARRLTTAIELAEAALMPGQTLNSILRLTTPELQITHWGLTLEFSGGASAASAGMKG